MRPHAGDGIVLDGTGGLRAVIGIFRHLDGAEGVFLNADSGHRRCSLLVQMDTDPPISIGQSVFASFTRPVTALVNFRSTATEVEATYQADHHDEARNQEV